MKIPTELLSRWKELRSHGDLQKIVESIDDKVSDSTISNAFINGQCNDEVFEAMAEYYKEKEAMINGYLKVA